MLIESKIRRANGTRVELDGVLYHFLPDDTGRHVCEVDNPDHVDIFVAIPEGYRVARRERAEAAEVKPEPAQQDDTQGDDEGDDDQEQSKPVARRGRKPKGE